MADAKTKDYSSIAAAKITRPSATRRPKNLLFYASNKKGKTRLCATAPDVLFIDPENGTDLMLHLDPQVWHIEAWEDYDDVYKFLRSGKHDFKWVALDGVTRIHNMALRYVMKLSEERDLDRRPGMVDRRDHGKAGELTKGLVTNFHALDIGVIFTAQEKTTKPSEEEATDPDWNSMTVPDLPDGVRKHVNSLVDVIGRLYVHEVQVKAKGPKGEDIVKPKKQRRLFIAPHEHFDTGYRSDYELPDFIRNPTVPKLVSLIETGEEQ